MEAFCVSTKDLLGQLPVFVDLPLRLGDLGLVLGLLLPGLEGEELHLLLEGQLGAVALVAARRGLLLLLLAQSLLPRVPVKNTI